MVKKDMKKIKSMKSGVELYRWLVGISYGHARYVARNISRYLFIINNTTMECSDVEEFTQYMINFLYIWIILYQGRPKEWKCRGILVK